MDIHVKVKITKARHKKGLTAAIERRRTKYKSTCTCTHCRIDRLEMELLINLRNLLQFSICHTSIDAVLSGIRDAMQDAMNMMLVDGKDPGIEFTSESGEAFTFTDRPSEAVRQFGSSMMSETSIYKEWVDMCTRLSDLSRLYGVD